MREPGLFFRDIREGAMHHIGRFIERDWLYNEAHLITSLDKLGVYLQMVDMTSMAFRWFSRQFET